MTLFRTPEIDRIEPKYILASNIETVYISGRKFDGLAYSGDAFECLFNVGDMTVVKSNGVVIDQAVVECHIDQIARLQLEQVKAPATFNISFKTLDDSSFVLKPFYAKHSNNLILVNRSYLVNASINKVSITSQIELGSFKVTVRNS